MRDAGELRRILTELGNRKIVLIDTTGISQRDRLRRSNRLRGVVDAGSGESRLARPKASNAGLFRFRKDSAVARR